MRWALGLLFSACVALAPAAQAAPAAAGSPVEIYAILSTTGNAGFFGSLEVRSLAVLEENINAAGGIKGRPVHFTVLDDQTNPQVSVQLVNQLIAKNVPVFLGPIIPPACAAVGPLINRAGPVGFCLNPSAHPEAGGYQFSAIPNNVEGAIAVLRYLRGRGLTRIAYLNAIDGAGQEATASFNAALRDPSFRTMSKVAEESYNPADVSVNAQVTRIKASGAQAIISWNVGLPFGTVLRSMNDAGLDIPIVTTGGNMTLPQMQAYAAFLPTDLIFEGNISWAPGAVGPGPIRDAQNNYVAALQKAGLRPQAPFATVWDPALLIVDAYRKIGLTADATTMRNYFDGLHGWVGLTGVYDFISYPKRGLGANALQLFRYDKTSGTFVPLGKRGGAL